MLNPQVRSSLIDAFSPPNVTQPVTVDRRLIIPTAHIVQFLQTTETSLPSYVVDDFLLGRLDGKLEWILTYGDRSHNQSVEDLRYYIAHHISKGESNHV